MWVDSFLIVLDLHGIFPWIFPISGIKADGSSLLPGEWAQFVWKVFLMEVLGKCVSYKCVNSNTSKGSFAFAQEGMYQCEGKTLT